MYLRLYTGIGYRVYTVHRHTDSANQSVFRIDVTPCDKGRRGVTLCHVPKPTGDAYARSHPAAVRQRHWRGGACCRAFGPGETDAPLRCRLRQRRALALAANDTEALVEF